MESSNDQKVFPVQESFGLLQTFLKHGAYKLHGNSYSPLHFLSDRVVLENATGSIEVEIESVLHLALNLVLVARDSPASSRDIAFFSSECQSLLEDMNNKQHKRGTYLTNPELPLQYKPKTYPFRQWTGIAPFDKNKEPTLSKMESRIKHRFLTQRFIAQDDVQGYRQPKGCPSGPPPLDVYGIQCGICEHSAGDHASWDAPGLTLC